MNHHFTRLASCLLLLFSGLSYNSMIDTYEFESEQQRARFMRCPKGCVVRRVTTKALQVLILGCLLDMRQQIVRLLKEGRSDQEIKQFMVDRYDVFVLYRPPLQRSTLLLWGFLLSFF